MGFSYNIILSKLVHDGRLAARFLFYFLLFFFPIKIFLCEIALSRKDMPDHLRDNLVTHTSLHATKHKKLEKENEKLKKKVAKQQDEIAKLNTEVSFIR